MYDISEFSQWLSIGNVGFPIVITMYLLIRFENKIDNLEKAIVNLGETIKSDRSE